MIFLLLMTLTQQAEINWQNRDRPGMTEQAITMWTESVHENPDQPTVYIQLTKACGRAVRHASTSADRKRWADRALEYGGKAVAKNPQSSEAFAVYGEALGQWANAHKGVHSLMKVRQALNALQKAIELDPHNAYAHMLMAEFYRQSPRLFSVGDKSKALEQARLAVHDGPQYAINHLVLARACLDLRKKEEGLAELQKIVTLTPPPDAVPETRADQATARAMLREMGITSASPPCGEAGGLCAQ